MYLLLVDLVRTDHLIAMEWAVPVLATLRLSLLDYRLGAETFSLDIAVVATSCQSLILLIAASGTHVYPVVSSESTFRMHSSAIVFSRIHLQTAVDRRVIHLIVDMVHLVRHHLHRVLRQIVTGHVRRIRRVHAHFKISGDAKRSDISQSVFLISPLLLVAGG